MSQETDWSTPLGTEGQVAVQELVRYDDLGRLVRDRPLERVELSRVEVAGHLLVCAAIGWARLASVDGAVVASLDLQRRVDQDEEGGWSKPIELFGRSTRATLRHDDHRGSRLRGPLRFLTIGDGAWCWHFLGGRVAGERLVLGRGSCPGGEPLVTTYPAVQGRSMGKASGGATSDRHVTSWLPTAGIADLVVAELFAAARLDGLVDYRAARLAGGVQELVGYVPRVEGNTE